MKIVVHDEERKLAWKGVLGTGKLVWDGEQLEIKRGIQLRECWNAQGTELLVQDR